MSEALEDQKLKRAQNSPVHMANERTFLAWIRTSIGIMAFGFVVEKFALFTKQMSLFLGESTIEASKLHFHSYSSVLGIFLVGLGTLLVMLAYIRYKKVAKQIDEDIWQPTSILDLLLTISVFAVGIFLISYLIYTI